MHSMEHHTRARPAGSLPALISAGVAFATASVYVGVIVAQGSADVAQTVVVTVWILALGACALVGGVRTTPDRVIPLGAASGGLIGAAILSLLTMGVLLLVAGILALISWIRSGVEASPRDQVLGGVAGVAAALGFFGLVVLL
jgi:phosphate/sulfate permease